MNLSRNHTATHLVNKILRDLLNDRNLIQKASLIHEDYFIFEYSSINTDKSNEIFPQLEKQVHLFPKFLLKTQTKIFFQINEIIQSNLPLTVTSHTYNSIRSDPNICQISNESYPNEVRCVNIDSTYSRELCCGTHVSSTKQIEDFLLVRVDSKGQSNKRLYCVTGRFAAQIRNLFHNDFQKRFSNLETNRDHLPLDELYDECRKLREIYLDEKSLTFPFNQRSNYYNRWKELMPDKKLLRKYLSNQINDNLKRNFISSNADLPIYDIGFMLLRYNDENNLRRHQSFVIYINSAQKILIFYLKNPRQREKIIEHMKTKYRMKHIDNFDEYDQQTRDLFTTTKKLLVFQPNEINFFEKTDFDQLTTKLFSIDF